ERIARRELLHGLSARDFARPNRLPLLIDAGVVRLPPGGIVVEVNRHGVVAQGSLRNAIVVIPVVAGPLINLLTITHRGAKENWNRSLHPVGMVYGAL